MVAIGSRGRGQLPLMPADDALSFTVTLVLAMPLKVCRPKESWYRSK